MTPKILSGYNDFNHIAQAVKTHEESTLHIHACTAATNFLNAKDVASVMHQQSLEEAKFWAEAVSRIVEVVILIAGQNLPFRGHDESPNSCRKGIFLKFVEFLAKRDRFLEKLIHREKGSVR